MMAPPMLLLLICRQRLPGAVGSPCDISSEDSVAAAVGTVMAEWGRLDRITNAAIGDVITRCRAGFCGLAAGDCGQSLRRLSQTREAGRVMSEGGSVINIASQAAKTGFRQMAPHVASMCMIGLTWTSAIDLAPLGGLMRMSKPCHHRNG